MVRPWGAGDSATLMTGPWRRNWDLHHGNVGNSPAEARLLKDCSCSLAWADAMGET